jgi:radical SAM superfamily enzyme YgiQ (UPF0313 family)
MNIALFSMPMHPVLEREIMKLVPPLGVFIIAGILRKEGHYVEVYDHQTLLDAYDTGWDAECVAEIIQSTGIEIVGISANTFSWGMAKQLIQVIKNLPNPPYVFCGGVHPSFYPTHILSTTDCDAIIFSEGETAAVKLVEAIEKGRPFKGIDNVAYKDNGVIVKNKFYEPKIFTDFGEPAYDLIPEGVYFNMPTETSRGCYFHCGFCSILDAHNWRGLDVSTSVNRIQRASLLTEKKSLYNSVYLVDNCFSADVDRAAEILKAVTFDGGGYTLQFEARCSDILSKGGAFVKAINPDRVSTIQIGVECGYDEALKRLNKGLTVNMVDRTLEVLDEIDLAKKTLISFIVGLPWETREDCIRTIEYAKELEDKYNMVIGVNWWLPLQSPITNVNNPYGIRLDPHEYDDPLWSTKLDFLRQFYKGLSIQDIEYLCQRYLSTLTNLTNMM